jgi:hypothetical protein
MCVARLVIRDTQLPILSTIKVTIAYPPEMVENSLRDVLAKQLAGWKKTIFCPTVMATVKNLATRDRPSNEVERARR